jgi:hypothetical protein
MLASFHLRVDKQNIRTLQEECEYLQERLWLTGNFFACDVHPNRVKASLITARRLANKVRSIELSDEFRYG